MSSAGGGPVSPAEYNQTWHMMAEGHYAEALQRWDSFIARDLLNPGRYRAVRGIALLLLGDPQAALADFLEVRKPMGKVRLSIPLIGTALWLQGEHEAACQDWASEIFQWRTREITHTNAVPVPALLWWASAHSGLERWRPLAVEELRRIARTKWCQESDWPGPLAPFLLGRSSAEALLAAVPDPDPFRTCWFFQAHFYIGAASLSRGELLQYQEQLVLALNQGTDTIAEPEFHLARAELEV